MSYCKSEGKDKVIFVTKEDHSQPSKVKLSDTADDEPQGLITSDGKINWSCPCAAGMVAGPCGVEFRNAFGCFHSSTEEPKGSDCFDNFKAMQECFLKYPTLYGASREGDEDENDELSELTENLTDDKSVSKVSNPTEKEEDSSQEKKK